MGSSISLVVNGIGNMTTYKGYMLCAGRAGDERSKQSC